MKKAKIFSSLRKCRFLLLFTAALFFAPTHAAVKADHDSQLVQMKNFNGQLERARNDFDSAIGSLKQRFDSLANFLGNSGDLAAIDRVTTQILLMAGRDPIKTDPAIRGKLSRMWLSYFAVEYRRRALAGQSEKAIAAIKKMPDYVDSSPQAFSDLLAAAPRTSTKSWIEANVDASTLRRMNLEDSALLGIAFKSMSSKLTGKISEIDPDATTFYAGGGGGGSWGAPSGGGSIMPSAGSPIGAGDAGSKATLAKSPLEDPNAQGTPTTPSGAQKGLGKISVAKEDRFTSEGASPSGLSSEDFAEDLLGRGQAGSAGKFGLAAGTAGAGGAFGAAGGYGLGGAGAAGSIPALPSYSPSYAGGYNSAGGSGFGAGGGADGGGPISGLDLQGSANNGAKIAEAAKALAGNKGARGLSGGDGHGGIGGTGGVSAADLALLNAGRGASRGPASADATKDIPVKKAEPVTPVKDVAKAEKAGDFLNLVDPQSTELNSVAKERYLAEVNTALKQVTAPGKTSNGISSSPALSSGASHETILTSQTPATERYLRKLQRQPNAPKKLDWETLKKSVNEDPDARQMMAEQMEKKCAEELQKISSTQFRQNIARQFKESFKQAGSLANEFSVKVDDLAQKVAKIMDQDTVGSIRSPVYTSSRQRLGDTGLERAMREHLKQYIPVVHGLVGGANPSCMYNNMRERVIYNQDCTEFKSDLKGIKLQSGDGLRIASLHYFIESLPVFNQDDVREPAQAGKQEQLTFGLIQKYLQNIKRVYPGVAGTFLKEFYSEKCRKNNNWSGIIRELLSHYQKLAETNCAIKEAKVLGQLGDQVCDLTGAGRDDRDEMEQRLSGISCNCEHKKVVAENQLPPIITELFQNEGILKEGQQVNSTGPLTLDCGKIRTHYLFLSAVAKYDYPADMKYFDRRGFLNVQGHVRK